MQARFANFQGALKTTMSLQQQATWMLLDSIGAKVYAKDGQDERGDDRTKTKGHSEDAPPSTTSRREARSEDSNIPNDISPTAEYMYDTYERDFEDEQGNFGVDINNMKTMTSTNPQPQQGRSKYGQYSDRYNIPNGSTNVSTNKLVQPTSTTSTLTTRNRTSTSSPVRGPTGLAKTPSEGTITATMALRVPEKTGQDPAENWGGPLNFRQLNVTTSPMGLPTCRPMGRPTD